MLFHASTNALDGLRLVQNGEITFKEFLLAFLSWIGLDDDEDEDETPASEKK